MYSEIVREPQMYLDQNGEFIPEATTFVITGENLEYLIQMLHSNIVTYFFKTFYAGGGLGESGIRYKKAFLENLPIPKLTREINNCTEVEIAKLYSLTDEELAFIDSQ